MPAVNFVFSVFFRPSPYGTTARCRPTVEPALVLLPSHKWESIRVSLYMRRCFIMSNGSAALKLNQSYHQSFLLNYNALIKKCKSHFFKLPQNNNTYININKKSIINCSPTGQFVKSLLSPNLLLQLSFYKLCHWNDNKLNDNIKW